MSRPNGDLGPNFTLNAAGLLTPAGHNQLIIIADESLPVAEGCPEFHHAGSEAHGRTSYAALVDLAGAYPLEPKVGYYMLPDGETPKDIEDSRHPRPLTNKRLLEALGIGSVGLHATGDYRQQFGSVLDEGGSDNGFYDLIWHGHNSFPPRKPIVCRTFSKYAFDCIVVMMGHSQTMQAQEA